LPVDALGEDAAKLRERVILGIRPEHFVELDRDDHLWAIEGDVTVEENLGVEMLVFFPVNAAPVETDEIVSIREGDEEGLLGEERHALFTARLPSGRRQLAGKKIRLGLDPERCYFFDPDTGESLLIRAAADEPIAVTASRE
jgi:ABC-type sugar transport system ATPase subunit